VRGPEALGVAEGRLGVCQEEVGDRRGLRRLQVGVVGGGGLDEGPRERGERPGQAERGVVQVEGRVAGDQAEGDAERLPPRAPRAQPPGGGAADALGQERLARVEGVAELLAPWEGGGVDRLQRQQAVDQRRRGGRVDPAALGERDRVREVGGRQRRREARARLDLDPVRPLDELRGGSAAQAAAVSEIAAPGRDGAQAGSSSTSTSTVVTPDTSSRRRTAAEGR
jgi:hypothetical protein